MSPTQKDPPAASVRSKFVGSNIAADLRKQRSNSTPTPNHSSSSASNTKLAGNTDFR